MTEKDARLTELTEREREIIHCLSLGMSNADIADKLYLSATTVKWYTRQIYSKLQLEDHADKRAAAAAFALELENIEKHAAHLPADLTPFIGRETELAELCNLLRQPFPRLVTVLGLGGVGKSRLILQAAHQLTAEFHGYVYFVKLQNANNTNDVLRAIGHELDCLPNAVQDYFQAIVLRLVHRRTLLVLDNVEQLSEIAMLLMALLEEAPELQILLSSRRQLMLNCETVFPLAGMKYPSANSQDNPLDYDAIRYFLMIAKQVDYHWQASPQDLADIQVIAALVDGLPLALNFAARCLPTLPLAKIAADIATKNDLLRTAALDVPERQRSIDIVLEWLMEQFSAEQAAIFASLGLFVGDFTLDAAKTIANTNQFGIQFFIHWGLIEASQDARFKLHPLVQRYALHQLLQSPHCERSIEAFVAYYLRLAENLKLDLFRGREALDSFEREWTHIRMAWQYAIEKQDWQSLESLLEPLHFFAWRRSYFHEAIAVFEAALAALEDSDVSLKAQLNLRQSHILTHLRPITDANSEQIKVQLQSLAKHDVPKVHAFALLTLGLVQRGLGHMQAAYDCAQDAFALYETIADEWGMMVAQYQMGVALLLSKNSVGALDHWRQCQALNERVGDDLFTGLLLHNMAGLQWRSGENQQALENLQRARNLTEPLRDKEMLGGLTQLSSVIHFSQGNFEQAAQERELSLSYYTWVQDKQTIAYLRTQAVYEALLNNDLAQATAIMETIESDLENPIISTCSEHLGFAMDARLPSPEILKIRIQQLENFQANFEAILTASLLLANLARSGDFRTMIALAVAINQTAICPRWFRQLPASRYAFSTAQQHMATNNFEAIWQEFEAQQTKDWLESIPS